VTIAYALTQFREKVRLIRETYPDESEADLADTIEGESADLDKAIVAGMREAVSREAMAEGLKALMDDLQKRHDRLTHSAKAMREAACTAMTEAGMEKLSAPDMSLSIAYAPASVIVTDETAVPDRFWRVKREVNRAAVMVEMRHGAAPVPGCELSNRKPYVRVTRR
jgi:phage host-nuclease inhibitor protein Gam